MLHSTVHTHFSPSRRGPETRLDYPHTVSAQASQHLLDQAQSLRLQNLADRVTDLLRVRREDAGRADPAIEHQLHRDPARHADVARHGRVSRGVAVRLERRRERVPRAVRPLDDEPVLEHDEVALARAVRHQLLELRAERVEQVAVPDRRLRRREEPDPLEPRDDAPALALVGELRELLHLRDERAVGRNIERGQFCSSTHGTRDVPLARVRRADRLLEYLRPRQAVLHPLSLLGVQPPKRHEGRDELGEALVAQRATDNRSRLEDVVELAEQRLTKLRFGNVRNVCAGVM